MAVKTFSLHLAPDDPQYPSSFKYEHDAHSPKGCSNLWLDKTFFSGGAPQAILAAVVWPVPEDEESDAGERQFVLGLKQQHRFGTVEYWSEGEPRQVSGLYLDPDLFGGKSAEEPVLLIVDWRD